MKPLLTTVLAKPILIIALLVGGRTVFALDFVIPEPALQNAIARSLGVSERSLTKSLVEKRLLRLQANDLGIRDLTGLEHATNLESLVLRDNLIDDLSPIENLSKLKNLDLSGNRLTDLSTLARLTAPSLRILNLSRNRLLGLSGVAGFRALAQLDVSSNALIDLEGVGKLQGLVNLYAQGNQLGRVENFVDRNRNKEFDEGETFTDESGNGKRDTDPLIELKRLPNLASLHLYDNRIELVDQMQDLPALHTLLLSGNLIETISPLSRFQSLKILALGNNRIHTLKGLHDLKNLERLNLSENQICDLRILRELKKLNDLDLNTNLITDVSDLSGLSQIHTLGLSRNLIRDPSPILRLSAMRRLILSFNQIPVHQTNYQDLFGEAQSRGVYLNVRNQSEHRPKVHSLVRSLIGHPQSNAILGNFLREQGYARFIDLLLDQNIKSEEMDAACQAWEEALKFDRSITNLPFPGK
ncbi:MAG: leucine-rich repeat domain-containing protein [Opitutae bacterium]